MCHMCWSSFYFKIVITMIIFYFYRLELLFDDDNLKTKEVFLNLDLLLI
jgi:hypothetical protein